MQPQLRSFKVRLRGVYVQLALSLHVRTSTATPKPPLSIRLPHHKPFEELHYTKEYIHRKSLCDECFFVARMQECTDNDRWQKSCINLMRFVAPSSYIQETPAIRDKQTLFLLSSISNLLDAHMTCVMWTCFLADYADCCAMYLPLSTVSSCFGRTTITPSFHPITAKSPNTSGVEFFVRRRGDAIYFVLLKVNELSSDALRRLWSRCAFT